MAACEALASLDVPGGTALVVENPLGTCEESARALNATLKSIVPATDVFLVDHFLGMTAILTREGLRFTNRVLEPIWHATRVESIDVVFEEAIGLNGLGECYDVTGATRDMIQSHLVQALAVVLAEPPAGLDDRHAVAAEALRSLRLRGTPAEAARRARYTAGALADGPVPDYVDEDGVDAARGTETLAQLVLESDAPRWRGVPLTLRSGQALAADRMEIVLRFRSAAGTPAGLPDAPTPNALRIDLLDGSIRLELNVAESTDPTRLARISLASGVAPSRMSEYGRVLRAVLAGDLSRAVPADAAVEGGASSIPCSPRSPTTASGWRSTRPAGGPPPGWET